MAIDGAEIADGGTAGLGPGLVGLDGGRSPLSAGVGQCGGAWRERAAWRDQSAGHQRQRHRGIIEELAERRRAQLLLARRLLIFANPQLLPNRGRRRGSRAMGPPNRAGTGGAGIWARAWEAIPAHPAAVTSRVL